MFDLKARKSNRLEIRAYFEYLPGAWDPNRDIAVFDPDFDPASSGMFNWKYNPVIEGLKIYIRSRNTIYETLSY